MKKWVLFTGFLMAACSGTVEKPENLISEKVMVEVFYDLALIDAMRSQQPARVNYAPNVRTYIYEKYNIDSLQFAQSNRYYAADVTQYRNMVQEVAQRLRDQQNTLEEETGNKAISEDEGQIR